MLHLNEPAHFEDFVRLNTAWITRYFALEPPDHILFARPVAIIEQGGCLLSLTEPRPESADGTESATIADFSAKQDRGVVGVCAVLRKEEGVYELSKMAVDERYQGRGLGNLLMLAALDWARQRGARKMTLITNSQLQAAIAMYRKHGFVTTWEGPHPEYTRGDVLMEKALS